MKKANQETSPANGNVLEHSRKLVWVLMELPIQKFPGSCLLLSSPNSRTPMPWTLLGEVPGSAGSSQEQAGRGVQELDGWPFILRRDSSALYR